MAEETETTVQITPTIANTSRHLPRSLPIPIPMPPPRAALFRPVLQLKKGQPPKPLTPEEEELAYYEIISTMDQERENKSAKLQNEKIEDQSKYAKEDSILQDTTSKMEVKLCTGEGIQHDFTNKFKLLLKKLIQGNECPLEEETVTGQGQDEVAQR